MRVLVTGVNGFIGRNLVAHMGRLKGIEVSSIARESSTADLVAAARTADFVFHLAAANRPVEVREFDEVNVGLTRLVCAALLKEKRKVTIVYTSSIQTEFDSPYGKSKLAAEGILQQYSCDAGALVHLYRLPNVFGKWSRPNYNSAVATFCYNIARDLPIEVRDPAAKLHLVYIDDVIAEFMSKLNGMVSAAVVSPVYDTTVGDVATLIRAFRASRINLISERVGAGLTRALYATYVSFQPIEQFAYSLTKHSDARGDFVEMLKTKDSGQFSYFTAHPGMTRGSHFHHSKTEKFLIIQGKARFRFRNMATDESVELTVSGEKPQIVESIPGWAHDISNIGDRELIVMLWANEMFDHSRPDTFTQRV